MQKKLHHCLVEFLPCKAVQSLVRTCVMHNQAWAFLYQATHLSKEWLTISDSKYLFMLRRLRDFKASSFLVALSCTSRTDPKAPVPRVCRWPNTESRETWLCLA